MDIFTVKKERKLLKKLIKEPDNQNIRISKQLDPYYLNQLASKHLIAFKKTNKYDPRTSTYISKPFYRVMVTQQGLHYLEKRSEISKELLLKSFWLPLGVALITSILTNAVLYTI